MKYIIYGAGESGYKALYFLGYHRVNKFTDNYKAGTIVAGKEVITYEDMRQLYEAESDLILVIASEKYWREMEQQVLKDNFMRFFVFHENDINEINSYLPSYWLYHQVVTLSYMQSLSKFHLKKYQHIGIYGVNNFLHYLIAEVMEQSPFAKIVIMEKHEGEPINTLGVDIVDFDMGLKSIDCLILNVKHCEDPVREELTAAHKDFEIVDLAELETLEPAYQHKELSVYKERHKGKRIFVIGNGPSLRIEDLNKLHENKEICIGSNRIYRVYKKTYWRADYIGIGDLRGICHEEILQLGKTVFLADNDLHIPLTECKYNPDIHYFHQIRELFYPNRARFSNDFTKGFYSGATITYDFGIQLAAYLGAGEIYLLGVDNSYPTEGNWKNNHFMEDYYTESEIKKFEVMGLTSSSFEFQKVMRQYEAAEIYSRAHGFRIYNATRGGELETFERVAFDNLF